MNTIAQLAADYGPKVLAWIAVVLTSLMSKYVWALIQNGTVRGVVERAWAELIDAVREVGQTYVDALKEGAADGKLTADEAAEARKRALATFKANLGPKGLARLGRVLGVDVESWARSKLETVVDARKTSMLSMRAPSSGAPPDPSGPATR